MGKDAFIGFSLPLLNEFQPFCGAAHPCFVCHGLPGASPGPGANHGGTSAVLGVLGWFALSNDAFRVVCSEHQRKCHAG